MATAEEMSEIMAELQAAYPSSVTRRGVPGYAKFLQDIPGAVLRAAVREHIRKKAWVPRIPELRLEAARLAGRMIFDAGQSRELIERQLFGIQMKLRGEYRRGEGLDEAAWEMLIAAYAQIGCYQSAQGARRWLEEKLIHHRVHREGQLNAESAEKFFFYPCRSKGRGGESPATRSDKRV